MMAYTAAQQRRMQATEELANRLAAIRQEIEARSAAGVRPVAVPAPAGIDAGSLIGDRLRKSPQDYKNLTPYMRSLYNAASRRATPNVSLASAEKYPDTEKDVQRKADLAKMALIGRQRFDTTNPKKGYQADLNGATAAAKEAERKRFTPGSDYQKAVIRRRELAAAAQAQNSAKNMRSAYARGVLRPGAVSLGVQQGILPDEQGMAAARAIAMIQAQHPTREPDPLKSIIAARIQQDPGLLDRMYGLSPEGGVQTPNPQAPQQPPQVNTLPNGGSVTRTPPSPAEAALPAPPRNNGFAPGMRITPDGKKVFVDANGKVYPAANPLDYGAPMMFGGG